MGYNDSGFAPFTTDPKYNGMPTQLYSGNGNPNTAVFGDYTRVLPQERLASQYNPQGITNPSSTGISGFLGSEGFKNGLSGFNSLVGTGSSLANLYLGFKGYGLAKDQFDFQKDSFNRNFAMMQDQYYRKLNKQRSNAEFINGGYQNGDAIRNYYDSGTNLEGANNTYGSSVAPSQSAFVDNAVQGQVPVTAAASALANTNVGPAGNIKKKTPKKDNSQSGDKRKENIAS